MCGIVGVVRRRAVRPAPNLGDLLEGLAAAAAALEAMDATDGSPAPGGGSKGRAFDTARVQEAAAHVEAVDAALRGVPGVQALLADPGGADALARRAAALWEQLDALEATLDAGAITPAELEAGNAALVRAKDAVWAVTHDRLRTARAVAGLAGPAPTLAALEAFTSVQVALSALDRLEVRGRDSAGLHVLVRHHGLDLSDPAVAEALAARTPGRLFGSGSVRCDGEVASFVYKSAAEIGELGDNTAVLRAAIRDDALLHAAVAPDTAQAVVLGHTRWASVGIISEANAHPLNSDELDGVARPYVVAVLNGDVDNHADLAAREGLAIPDEITTDAKVIPTLVARALARGQGPLDAVRAAVASLEGSVAVAACTAADPARLFLALRGSGQALYVGLAEDAFVVASEPYGLVEETSRYLRMDGETPVDQDRPAGTRGQIVVVDAAQAGELSGVQRVAYDGTPLPYRPDDIQHAQITTRDIDRGEYPHFLLKEISEAPGSFRKTLRGKIRDQGDGRLTVELPPGALPDEIRGRLASGEIRTVFVVGQGTAAVAGEGSAAALAALAGHRLRVEARLATELSGFGLRDDMRDTLVIAISQSGTTTDTNRTVDLVRARGASVISIVNRRNSDLVDKSDGVLFTSDGRDVEMSVASTKAFYAQVAAGNLLSLAIADAIGVLDPAIEHELLAALRALPDAMRRILDQRATIAEIAQRHVLDRRYWAVVGNGYNAITARELRIKLSELCYKAVACDATEDKKHIDLSSEPLTLVCAAGLSGSNADDVAKEVAIYRAHRGSPVVIASDGRAASFAAAVDVVDVPAVHPALDYLLATVAGHLFCYEAALAIDASARPLREARAAVEASLPGPVEELLDRLAPALDGPARRFFADLGMGRYNGTLEASTAVRLAALLRYATQMTPLDVYELEFGKIGTPSTVVLDLTVTLTRAIDELTRPIDAIKHQAKTVTVGISRSDETLLQVPLVRQVLAAGTPRDGLSYRTLRTLVDLEPAIEEVVGFTRYRVEGDPGSETAAIHVVDRGGISVGIPSRTEVDPRLTGTKHRVATQREVTAVRGARDGRTLVIVPEVKHNQTVGLTLLHVRFVEHLPPAKMRAVLEGYQGRYGALVDAVTETEPAFDDALLGSIPVVDLLTQPVNVLAARWRRG